MRMHFFEPSLKKLLSEPIVTSLMKADGVDREQLVTMLREIAADLTSRSRKDKSKSQVRLQTRRGVRQSTRQHCEAANIY